MKKTLYLLYGGKSAEHDVSLQTAFAVSQAIDHTQYDVQPIFIQKSGSWIKGPQIEGSVSSVQSLAFSGEGAALPTELATTAQGVAGSSSKEANGLPVVFPLLHGTNGEDGTVQGMLELLNLPYVGNGVLSSAAGMDKLTMKRLFAQEGIPQVAYVGFIRSEWQANGSACLEQIEETLGYPCFVKPANLGSSVGISKCTNRTELKEAFHLAFSYDRKIIVEEGVVAREVEMGVIGNDHPECSVAGEIVPKTDFYDYNSKYEDGKTALIIPAHVTEVEQAKMMVMAKQAYKVLDCAGLARVDFFLQKDGTLLLNEVNTMPGFTPYSMFPLLWKHTGVGYPQLIQRLIELAEERFEEKQLIRYDK